MASPGHRKHTNETKINCDSGGVYQGSLKGPSLSDLYFHPSSSPCPLESALLAGKSVYAAVGPFLAAMDFGQGEQILDQFLIGKLNLPALGSNGCFAATSR